RLSNATDSDMTYLITQLRENSGAAEALIFTGNGRLVAFSSSAYGQLMPDLPPAHVMNQLKVARGYAAAEADADNMGLSNMGAGAAASSGDLHLRVVVPINRTDRYSAILGVAQDVRWLQVMQPVPEQIARNANLVQE